MVDGEGVDGIGGAREVGGDPFSMDAYYAALEEEIKSGADFYGEKTSSTGRRFGLKNAISEVRWVLST